jgi:hypothetical protein
MASSHGVARRPVARKKGALAALSFHPPRPSPWSVSDLDAKADAPADNQATRTLGYPFVLNLAFLLAGRSPRPGRVGRDGGRHGGSVRQHAADSQIPVLSI